jgi:hypothetical protein
MGRLDKIVEQIHERRATKPTIYEVLRLKLGREPTSAELKSEVSRIKEEALVLAATRGKLSHQKRRR